MFIYVYHTRRIVEEQRDEQTKEIVTSTADNTQNLANMNKRIKDGQIEHEKLLLEVPKSISVEFLAELFSLEYTYTSICFS